MTTQAQPKAAKEKRGRSKPLQTPPGLASFVHLDAPDSGREFSDDKFKLDLLFDKDTDLTVLKNAVKEAAIAMWGDKVNFKELALPFKDGNEKSQYEGYAGRRYVTLKTKKRPGIVGPDLKPLPEGVKIFGGCKVRANITAYTYVSTEKVRGEDGKRNTEQVNGVSFALNHVQLIKEGTPFGGGGVALSDAFDAVEPDLGGT